METRVSLKYFVNGCENNENENLYKYLYITQLNTCVGAFTGKIVSR